MALLSGNIMVLCKTGPHPEGAPISMGARFFYPVDELGRKVQLGVAMREPSNTRERHEHHKAVPRQPNLIPAVKPTRNNSRHTLRAKCRLRKKLQTFLLSW